MTNQDIFELIDRFEASSLTEMKLSTEHFKIALSRESSNTGGCPAGLAMAAAQGQCAGMQAAVAQGQCVGGQAAVAQGQYAGVQTAAVQEQYAGERAVAAQEQYFITAPMVGACYAAPEPGQPPFVTPGARVSAGQTVCLMEAMKMISEIPAPCDCVIEEVLKADGEFAAFGEALYRYRPC